MGKASSIEFRELLPAHAEAIVAWRYDAPYDFYNVPADKAVETVAEMLRPEFHYLAVVDGVGDLVAFRCFGGEARVAGGEYSPDALDMGGGLRPDLTGKGLGRVVAAAMGYACERLRPARFRVTVAAFNVRARRVCESLGYRMHSEFVRPRDQTRFAILMRDAFPPA